MVMAFRRQREMNDDHRLVINRDVMTPFLLATSKISSPTLVELCGDM
jgi:hypothetical protein